MDRFACAESAMSSQQNRAIGAAEPEAIGPIPKALSDLHFHIAQLRDAVMVLERRLHPVLEPKKEGAAPGAATEQLMPALFSSQIDNAATNVAAIEQAIQDINARLHL